MDSFITTLDSRYGLVLQEKDLQLPKDVPSGCSVVIFVLIYGNKFSGITWWKHVAAVPTGGVVEERRNGRKVEQERREINEPIEMIVVDWHNYPSLGLPCESFERVDGAWRPSRSLR